MNGIMRYFSLFLALFALMGCEEEARDPQLNFIGDSIIARWDVAESFPSRQVFNYGRSDEGIEYLESLAGKFDGREVVVLIGTNDNYLMTSEDRREYAERYVAALRALGASRIYLYSVLPRDFGQDRNDVNKDIAEFNAEVQSLTADDRSVIYMNVYDRFLCDGEPAPQLYNDGLHLSPYGYEILTKALEKLL